MAVFLPVAIVSGITGELFRPFSLTVAIALGASLLVSMTIVPVLAYWFLNNRTKQAAAAVAAGPVSGAVTAAASTAEEEKVTRLQRGYLPVLNAALRRPVITLIIAALIFGGTMASTTLLKTNFLDSFADKTTLQIDQELPVGTRLTTTSEAAEKVEAILAAEPGVKEYLTTIGQGGSNRASYFVSLVDEDAYDTSFPALQSQFAELSGAGEVKLGSINTGTNNDVSYTVTGDDQKSLEAGAAMVENVLKSTPGLTEVTTDLSDRRPLLEIQLDQRKAASLGFTQGEVGQTIASALNGTTIGTVELQGDSRDIKIRPQDAGGASPKRIGALELPVSQVQQQQAVDRATDRLERKGDKLKAKGDRLTDAGDALGDRQESLGDRQKAAGEEQQEEALAAAAEQRGELRESLADARDAVSSSRRQLARR